MKCTHSINVPARFVANPYHDPEEWEVGGWDSGPYLEEEGGEESTFVDTSLHTYKCTQCNEVFYYSQRAKENAQSSV